MLRNGRIIIDDEDYVEDYDKDYDKQQDIVFSKHAIVNDYIKNVYNSFIFCFEYVYKGFKLFIKVSGIYIVWIFLHYIASHLYIKLCVPRTFVGFLMSPFMTATPHCQGLRWVVYNAANMINNMWIIFGAWICSVFLVINRDGSSPTPIPVHMPLS